MTYRWRLHNVGFLLSDDVVQEEPSYQGLLTSNEKTGEGGIVKYVRS